MAQKNRPLEGWNFCEMEEFVKNCSPSGKRRMEFSEYPEFLRVWLRIDAKDGDARALRAQSSFREFGEGAVENAAGYALSWRKPFKAILSTPEGRMLSLHVDPILEGSAGILYFILRNGMTWDGTKRRLKEEEVIKVSALLEDAVKAWGYKASFMLAELPKDFDA